MLFLLLRDEGTKNKINKLRNFGNRFRRNFYIVFKKSNKFKPFS